MFKCQLPCHLYNLGYGSEPILKTEFTYSTVRSLTLHTPSCLSVKFAMRTSQYYLEVHLHCHVAALHIPIEEMHTLVV